MPQIGNTTSCYHRKHILSKHKGILYKICQMLGHESNLNKFHRNGNTQFFPQQNISDFSLNEIYLKYKSKQDNRKSCYT